MTILDISPEAAVVISRMRDKAVKVAMTHGDTSPEYLKSAESIGRVLAAMIGLGGRITTADFDLGEGSLYGVNEYGISYGVVFDPTDTTWSVHS